jgi:NDP-sugar pyrophosphorylase family protein
MKAIILAAGLGTRLKPITEKIPKALLDIKGTTLLELAIRKLCKHGVDSFVVNIHHKGEQIIEFLEKKNYFNLHIDISDERDLLLDTGGALKKAEKFLKGDDAFFVYNVDTITDLDLSALFDDHKSSNAIATLAVMDRPSSRYLLVNGENVLCGWENAKTKEVIIVRDKNLKLARKAFSGIHVISPLLYNLMPEENVFSIISFYLKVAVNNQIKVFEHNDSTWMDVGKIQDLKAANEMILKFLP